MSRFNLQLYNRLNSQTEFIKYWAIRESAIKCYGDLTLNSIYRIKTAKETNVLKCEGKKDLEYYVFFHDNVCVCVAKNI
jgi:phosphopantetheinyl transferase